MMPGSDPHNWCAGRGNNGARLIIPEPCLHMVVLDDVTTKFAGNIEGRDKKLIPAEDWVPDCLTFVRLRQCFAYGARVCP